MGFRYLFFLAFILIISDLNAQSDFKPGYVILNNDDTLLGKIDSRGDKVMSTTCRFKSNNADSITIFDPGDIIEYRFIDGKCYVSRNLESGELIFLEYLINGKLNIYYYRNVDDEDFYLVDKEGLPLKIIPFKEEIRFIDDGTRVLYQSKLHVGLLQIYTNDADDFKPEPIKIIKPDHNNLIKLAENYHNTVCKDEKCIIYEKSVPFIKASFELIYGQTLFNKKYIEKDIHTSDFGLGIYFGMPRANERFYFKTGIKYCQYSYKDEKLTYKVIPTQIQYQYSHYKLIPKAFFGFNHCFFNDKSYNYTIALGIGLDYKFSKRFSVTTAYTSEFVPLSLRAAEIFSATSPVSDNFLSYPIHVGIKIDL
jgi:hypothetical protein